MIPLAVHIPFVHQSWLFCGAAGFGVIFSAIAAYFVSDALAAVPVENRQDLAPGQVWLLLIPLFGLV